MIKIKNSLVWLLVPILYASTVSGDELTHKFKNPSFSGQGVSAHYLTIDSQEKARRDKLQDDIESALLAAERASDNTTLAKFIRNLESRIYSQLSKNLVESLFSNTAGASFGSFTLEDSTVDYRKEVCDTSTMEACTTGQEVIILRITNTLDGSVTQIIIPIGVGNWTGDGSDSGGDGDSGDGGS